MGGKGGGEVRNLQSPRTINNPETDIVLGGWGLGLCVGSGSQEGW